MYICSAMFLSLNAIVKRCEPAQLWVVSEVTEPCGVCVCVCVCARARVSVRVYMCMCMVRNTFSGVL